MANEPGDTLLDAKSDLERSREVVLDTYLTQIRGFYENCNPWREGNAWERFNEGVL